MNWLLRPGLEWWRIVPAAFTGVVLAMYIAEIDAPWDGSESFAWVFLLPLVGLLGIAVLAAIPFLAVRGVESPRQVLRNAAIITAVTIVVSSITVITILSITDGAAVVFSNSWWKAILLAPLVIPFYAFFVPGMAISYLGVFALCWLGFVFRWLMREGQKGVGNPKESEPETTPSGRFKILSEKRL